MTDTIIDRLYQDNRTLINYLASQGEISLQSNVDSDFRKTLLLASASYFEATIKDYILKFVEEQTNINHPVLNFVKNKGIERQFHTFFAWEGRNANSFFGLFGGDFKDFMIANIQAEPKLEASIRAFLELGGTRNQLVHQNFATFTLGNR
jgi:RiboL-PSP-HEPN